MRKGLIFDLDGTLWDASDVVAEAWCGALRDFDCALRTVTPEMIRSVMGLTEADILQRFCPELNAEEGRALFDRCTALQSKTISKGRARLYPELVSVLKRLSEKYMLAVVSNCSANYLELFLGYPGVQDLFCDYEYSRTGLPKAGNISLVVERNGLTDALYIGDTVWDMQAAQTAGIPFLHAAYGYGRVPQGTPFIASLAELPAAAERLLK